ncbi:MAG: hypothetical protein JXB50_12645 [Spirochaetes bacterium]|nr:hypothetical protein [Spirochaetota bacterium]
MADKSIVKKLDGKLIKDNVIEKEYSRDYSKVHSFLNKKVKIYDNALKKENFKLAENDLRDWLNTLNKLGATQEKLTSYLRCGLAHLCFDYIDLNVRKMTNDEHITRALQSFKKRKYDKSYYKSSVK